MAKKKPDIRLRICPTAKDCPAKKDECVCKTPHTLHSGCGAACYMVDPNHEGCIEIKEKP